MDVPQNVNPALTGTQILQTLAKINQIVYSEDLMTAQEVAQKIKQVEQATGFPVDPDKIQLISTTGKASTALIIHMPFVALIIEGVHGGEVEMEPLEIHDLVAERYLNGYLGLGVNWREEQFIDPKTALQAVNSAPPPWFAFGNEPSEWKTLKKGETEAYIGALNAALKEMAQFAMQYDTEIWMHN